ncbi:MAG TPA: DnaA regulatory inactivator Hda [Burkholderiaceae bacterium]
MLLDLVAEKPQTLATFETGSNVELMHLLPSLAAGTASDRFAYLWGSPGAGKSHILRALSLMDKARYIACDAEPETFAFSDDIGLYLLDDCDKLSESAQLEAFALFNQVRENKGIMISAGNAAPAHLALREDLRTRLGWGLIYQVHELTDEEKIAALNQAAAARRINVSPGVLPYLITHFRRDMSSLSAMLDALDAYSLETKRPITLALLRDLLQLEKETAIE